MKKDPKLTKKLINPIVTEKRARSQYSGRKYINECSSESAGNSLISLLLDCVRDRDLTTAIDLLEKCGITGDAARFVIANLQDFEVAR